MRPPRRSIPTKPSTTGGAAGGGTAAERRRPTSKGTTLDRLVNTQAVIVRDRADIHYLKVLDGWMEAYGLQGQWSVSGVSPLAYNLARQPVPASAAEVLESSKSFDDPGRMLQANPPAIYISTTASVLIVTDGQPRYEPIH